ncbi:RNA-directed DNA polymerase, eukaryota [Tanacetum coccineum]
MSTEKWTPMNREVGKFNSLVNETKAMSGENDENLMTRIEILQTQVEQSRINTSKTNRHRVTDPEPELFGDDALPRPPGMHRIAKSQRSSNSSASSGSNPVMFQEMMQQQLDIERKEKIERIDPEVCSDYGTVVDVFIPFKKSKAGKRFAFVRFIKVKDLDRLVENLCTIWIGRFHIHANVARFHRPVKSYSPTLREPNLKTSKSSFASVLKGDSLPPVKEFVNSIPALVLDDTCLKDHDFSLSLMGKVKTVTAIPNLPIILSNEGFHNIKITYLGGMWVLFVMDTLESKDKLLNHTGVNSWFLTIKEAHNSFVCDERITWVSIEGLPIKAWTPNSFRKIASLWGEIVEWEDSDSFALSNKPLCLKTKTDDYINERRKVIIQGKFYWIRAKELYPWTPSFIEDKHDTSSSDDESEDIIGENFVGNNDKIDSSNIDRVLESSFSHAYDVVHDTSEDPNKNVTGDAEPHSEDPFNIYGILNKQNNKASNSSTIDPKFPLGFTPVNTNGDHIGVSEHVQSSKLKERNLNGGVSSHQSMNTCSSKNIAGGSILEVMDEIVKVGQTMGYNMEGLGNKTKKGWIKELCHHHMINFISIQETKMESIDLFLNKSLWGNLNFNHAVSSSVGFSGGILCVWDTRVFTKHHVSKSDYFVAIMGTWVPTSTKLFVISVYAPQEIKEKRDLWYYLPSLIKSQGANAFNNFISLAGLIDLPLEGYTYTWAQKSASKMSKLDRFLISNGLLMSFPHVSAICLDRHLSDHRPILLKEDYFDFGPTPSRIFHSWFSITGFESFVETTWKSMNVLDSNGLVRMKKKLQLLKNAIKVWIKEARGHSNEMKNNIHLNLSEVDKIIDQGLGNDEVIYKRTNLLKDLQELNSLDTSDISQKAKIRWTIKGDENTKYFHGCLNKKRSQLAIHGTLVNGEWISDLGRVKHEFFSHFKTQFSLPSTPRFSFDFDFPNRLSSDQVEDLERIVMLDEVKKAVWDCGANKSPGPDRFTFEFFRKFWSIIDKDVFHAVLEFFESGHIPRVCNASFIALIPKVHDAKIVKDFRPISLIGSIYKIIAKILANRLCNVLPCLINEVDFEKAFDSVKWEYILDTLMAFGFGQKWCKWINGCFATAMGSVLDNGSPTSEFQFQKGLKQGDPISPFLFILIMETLHLSFNRVIEANLFKASGLKINCQKSKLMGMGVKQEDVEMAANLVGCFNFTSPFKYLGIKVGDNMLRINSWDEVLFKVSNRLSNWKLKTLLIGGRFTLIKSVLSLIPLYHMSIFKAPMGWDKILASKKHGGLRVSSLYATNRALLFKWIWRFFSQDSSLWSRFIKALHDNHGAFSSHASSSRRSPWLDIIRETLSLSSKGIDLMQFLKKKIGNEACKSISVAVKLGQPSLTHSFRRPPRGGIEEEHLALLDSRITDISLPNMSDRWTWSLEAFGSFLVRSTRIYIDENILPKVEVPTRWVKWNLLPIHFSLVTWLVKSGVKLHAGGIWMLQLLLAMKIGLFGLVIFAFLCI